nr:hypothetical protein [Polyangiaceae bacterium]
EEGMTWQLCDAGIGWSYHHAPDETWQPFEQLNRMLPARITARPKGAANWIYELNLPTGAICVKLDAHGNPFWSIREKQKVNY